MAYKNFGGNKLLVWEWPQGKMAWFLWAYRGFFPDTRFWRVGPVTLQVIDRAGK